MKSKFKFQVFPSCQDRKTNSFVSFLEEVSARQFSFKIYLPLEGFMNKIHVYWQNWEREFVYLRTSLMLKFTYRLAKFNSEFWSHKRVKLFLKEHSKFHAPLLTSKFGPERRDLNWCRGVLWYCSGISLFVKTSSLLFWLASTIFWHMRFQEIFMYEIFSLWWSELQTWKQSFTKIWIFRNNFTPL